MKIAFSWDDGAIEDQKLFDLHEKYQIPGMFFVPTINREGRKVIDKKVIHNVSSELIKFGGHTENHTYLTGITLKEAEHEVLKNKDYLENILGYQINDFCLPGGKYNKKILDMLLCHFKTVRTADIMNFRFGERCIKPSIHIYPRSRKSLLGNCLRNRSINELYLLVHHRVENYFDTIKRLIEYEGSLSIPPPHTHREKCIVVWGHSWEIEELGLWMELEEIMKLSKKYDVCAYSALQERNG